MKHAVRSVGNFDVNAIFRLKLFVILSSYQYFNHETNKKRTTPSFEIVKLLIHWASCDKAVWFLLFAFVSSTISPRIPWLNN